MSQHRIAIAAFLVSLVAALPGYAQSGASFASSAAGPGSRDVAIGFAAGGIVSMDPDLGVRPAQWIVSVQRGITRHLVVEPEVGRWSFARDLPVPTSADRITSSVAYTFVGANLLGRFPVGSAAVFAGAGAGYYVYSRKDTGTISGTGYAYSWSGGGLGLQAVAGVDVHVTRRVTVFGAVRAQGVPAADLSTGSLLAGVRYAF